MNVIHVVPRIDEEASGPAYSVPALCRALALGGDRVSLFVTIAPPAPVHPGFELRVCPVSRFFPRLYFSPSLRQALREAAPTADIIHNHSLWVMPNVYPAWAVRGTRCRLVTSPRGTLSPVAQRRSRWLKRIMWLLAQGRAVRDSVSFHATTEAEFHAIRGVGLRAPVAVIPNGVDLPALPPFPPPGPRRRRLLFLGRIHPIKGIDLLLRAWRNLQRSAPDWELVLVGPDNDGYLAEMSALSRELGLERVHFPGPAYGPRKSEAYGQADLLVLPSRTENFGLTVAESLAHGLPAIATRGVPWPGLEKHDCGWWIEGSEGALTECLREAFSLSPEALRARGLRGRAWMERDFGWPEIGRKMHATYQWLLGGGEPPAWVQL